MNRHNLVTVIIPCYNQARYLGEAIESVLGQSYRNFQIIVVDDGSTDNTREVAARYEEVECLRQENRGLAEARNAGLRASRGEYLVFLDADDRLTEAALEAGVVSLETHPNCAFVYGRVRLVGADGTVLSMPEQAVIESDHYVELLRHNHIWSLGAVMYRREQVLSTGLFNSSINASADYDMNIRLASRFPVHCHGEVVLEYRKHGSNMTRNMKLMLASAVTARRNHRKYAKRNRRYEAALKEGINRVQKDYGEKLVKVVRDQLRNREVKPALSGLIALIRFYSSGLMKHAWGKILSGLRLKNNLAPSHKNSVR